MNKRPKRFQDVISQKIAIKLIMNALEKNTLPRVIMLHGESGIGKTTLARLISAWQVCTNKKEYNCEENNIQGKDVCGMCSMCKAVQTGSIPDILEFDAASHTSVDDIREILNQCNYAPQMSKEKTFIIDEAHMLSRNAIAALLKTFEDAPDHIRFILATTELDKISNAIRSRCFCIPLQEISENDIEKSIENDKEISIDKEAISLISKVSNGSMREAQSILFRAKTLENNITKKTLHDILFFIEEKEIEKIANFITNKEFEKLYEFLNKTLESNKVSAQSMLKQLIIHFQTIYKKENNKTQIIKIMIDLNQLWEKSITSSMFKNMIIIGLCNIAYNLN